MSDVLVYRTFGDALEPVRKKCKRTPFTFTIPDRKRVAQNNITALTALPNKKTRFIQPKPIKKPIRKKQRSNFYTSQTTEAQFYQEPMPYGVQFMYL